jgi:hypothetical protein
LGEKHTDPVKNMGSLHEKLSLLAATYFLKQTKSYTQSFKHIKYYLTSTRHDYTSAQRIYNWNTLVTGHKEG